MAIPYFGLLKEFIFRKKNLQLSWIKKKGDKGEIKERQTVKSGFTEAGYYWLRFIISNRKYKNY